VWRAGACRAESLSPLDGPSPVPGHGPLRHPSAERTASACRMVMTNALSFMSDPALARCVLPSAGAGFDIRAFIASGPACT
jgi:hypothetical protein